MKYAIYTKPLGAIDRTVSCAYSQIRNQLSADDYYVQVSEEVFDDTHYIDVESQQAKPRQAFHPQHEISDLTVTLINLPVGTEIRVGSEGITSDGDDSIEFDVPGDYGVELKHPHYLDETLEVSVG